MPRTLRIATRASDLALWQANHVAALLKDGGVPDVELVEVSTIGDRDRSEPLTSLGGFGVAGQGVFTKEVQRAVLDGRADLAVHSLKDLPTEGAAGLTLAGIPTRAETADVLLTRSPIRSIAELAHGARVGTGSPRRRAQLLRSRPDLSLSEIRGNVGTRLDKLDAGEFDAIVLAEAGLSRLAVPDRPALRLTPPVMWHAVGQAALGIECRADDGETIDQLRSISCHCALAETDAERAVLRELRAGCHAPVGVRSRFQERGGVFLEAVVLSNDGTERLTAAVAGTDPGEVGRRVAALLAEQGAQALIEA